MKDSAFFKINTEIQNQHLKTWQIIKKAIRKEKCNQHRFPTKIVVDKKSITNIHSIAENFNKFFTEIGPNLANKIDPPRKHFHEYLKEYQTCQPENVVSVNELKDAFFSLKINKSPGYDDISFNVVKKCFGVLYKPLLHIFNLSIQTGIFPDELKITSVTPIFKGGENWNLGNYRPIPILPCFSKIFERIMYNRLYKYLTDNNILYKKQFGFQTGHSTEHAIIQLVDQINSNFEKDQYTLGVFIDLSKAFDTVDHKTLIAKLENYGIKGINLLWFKSYLENRKQFIQYDISSTAFEGIICGVQRGSILEPLLFLTYIKVLHEASNLLDAIMFADNINLFCTHQNINDLFSTVNSD